MSQPRRSQFYAPVSHPGPAEPFDRNAALALLDDLMARRARAGALKTLRSDPLAKHATAADLVTAGSNPSRRRRDYAIAACVALAALGSSLSLGSRERLPLVPTARLGASTAEASITPSDSASPVASVVAPPRRQRAVQYASLGPGTLRPRLSEAVQVEPPATATDGQAADALAHAPPLRVQAAQPERLAATETASAPPKVQVAALETPPSAGEPLLIVRSQSDLLGRQVTRGGASSGLRGIQSGDPQRMLTGITGAAVR